MSRALIETILRSEFLGLRATVHFAFCEIQNWPGQDAALGFVLAMPLLKPITQHFHSWHSDSGIVNPVCSMTLLQELQALLEARSGAGFLPESLEKKMINPNSQRAEEGTGSIAADTDDEGSGTRSRTDKAKYQSSVNG